jgi:hypothetical protein
MELGPNRNSAGNANGGLAVIERPDAKLLRLAELVMHLTDSTAELAWCAMLEAVEVRGYPKDHEQCLARVARAMNSIRTRIDLRPTR